jgi:hypothetical protein
MEKVTKYWKGIAGFFGGAAYPIVAPLVQGDWPDASDWRMALGTAIAAAFFVVIAPKNTPA